MVFDTAPTGHTLRLLELPVDWSQQIDVKVFASVDAAAADDVARQRFGQVIEMMKRKVLFLCTGNSCRSQMAEAIVNARLDDQWQAFSAGTQPTGTVHPLAVRALSEIGIQHHGRSKHADEFREEPFDLVVTVCDDAAENCPVWLGHGQRVHMGFPDPAQAIGTEEEVMVVFRQVRDDIAAQIPALLQDMATRR